VIAGTNPVFTAAAVATVVLGASLFAPNNRGAAPGRLSGVIYSADADTQAIRGAAASLPEIDIGLDPAARSALPTATGLVVHFVGIDESTFTLTLARRFRETANPATGASKPASVSARRKSRRPVKVAAVETAPIVAAVAVSTPAAAPIVAPPPTPKPTFPPTFAEIDDALHASSTVQAVNVRIKKGGVSFRLTHVGLVDDRYVVRYAIANEEQDAFFLSIVNVSADGKPIHSETAGSYSCPPGQEVYGVVHFIPTAVAGKKVAIELVQSGGDHRRFPLTAEYGY
jgi:hypothetical protein